MKKRVFISIYYMEIGGAERSLLGLLNALDKTVYDIDLFVHSHQGEFMSLIPSTVNLLKEEPKYTTLLRPIKDILKEGYIDIVLARLFAKRACKCYMKRNGQTEGSAIFQYIIGYATPFLPPLTKYGKYDLAISFLAPHNIVLNKVSAKKKAAWIHTDYSTIQVNKKLELKIWEKYDYIVSISDDVTKTFLHAFPEVKDKIVLIENILSSSFVREQAELFDASNEIISTDKNTTNICSIGRFSNAKNFDNVPWICKNITEEGLKIKWFLIGYGKEQIIKEQIIKARMEQHVVLLGKKINPYPYIKACDIYVQPSRYEGKAVSVREAQMLCKPTVITNFPTAHSQLINNLDGIIVPLDNKQCAKGIIELIRNKEKQRRLIEYLQSHDYGNEKEAKKIDQLI